LEFFPSEIKFLLFIILLGDIPGSAGYYFYCSLLVGKCWSWCYSMTLQLKQYPIRSLIL